MQVPFELDGKVIKISFKELGARMWPFGKWQLMFNHPVTGEYENFNEPTHKQIAVSCFVIWKDKPYKQAMRIKKIGGFFNGIEFRPRTER